MDRQAALPQWFGLLWPEPGALPTEPDPEQWQVIARHAREHRLRPLLHARAKSWAFAPPTDLADDWAAAYRRSALRALQQKAELARLGRTMAESGIEAMVLKGGAIAWRGWFDPALRPMRDLDLLVGPENAERAQQALRDLGYTGEEGPNESNDKHLPGLLSPRTGTAIEIHLHLIEPEGSSGLDHDNAFRERAALRSLELPGIPLHVPSDTDTLLHLILHGALDHQFNNGPLLVFDVAALLEHGTIDWAAFWETAGVTGGVRAAQLVFAFVTALVPGLRVDWHGHEPQGLGLEALAGVAELMLVERALRTLVGLPGRILRHGWKDRFTELAKAVRRYVRRDPVRRSGKVAAGATPAGATLRQIGHGVQVARWLKG